MFYSNELFFDGNELRDALAMRLPLEGRLWTPLTSFLIERESFSLFISLVMVWLLLSEAEKQFVLPLAFLRFVLFVVLTSNIAVICTLSLWNAMTNSIVSLTISGGWVLYAAASVVLKRSRSPSNASALRESTYYAMPSVLFFSSLLLFFLIPSLGELLLCLIFGVIFGRIYFLFEHGHRDVELDENLQLHTFFPRPLGQAILSVRSYFYSKKNVLPLHSPASSPSSPPPLIPSKAPAETSEKRRAVGQRIVEERMAKRTTTRVI